MKKNILTILFLLSFVFQAESKSLTYKDVIKKTYSLSELAKLPPKGEKGALFSSYDRASKYDKETDSYVNWDANDDGMGIVRKEEENLVLVDINGPGVIWRMWSAKAGIGKVQIYLDGKLTCDLPFKDYFSGKIAPFNRKGLVYNAAKGWNNYTPISFQKSCKIVAEPKWGRPPKFNKYYHFNYTILPKGTKVQTFKMKLSPEENEVLDKASKKMTAGLGTNPIVYKNEKTETLNWTIPAGKSKSLTITGKRAITSLKVQVPEHKDYKDLLRQITLSINWDGEKEPSVWSPLGDFFGTAPGINLYKSLVMGMAEISSQWSVVSGQVSPPFVKGDRGISKTKNQYSISKKPDKISNIEHSISNTQVKEQRTKIKSPQPPLKKGDLIHQSKNPSNEITCACRTVIQKSNNPLFMEFYSYWYMPFEKRAEITIKNESDKPQEISLIVEHAPLKTSFDKLGYFHAKWHRDLAANPKRPLDWLILKTKGRGRFVGFALHIWNAKGGWWGEGDEKFFVDGEKFPSTYGTGSEDYFGYAWCSAHEFSKPFHSQPTNSNNKGHISNNRWHIGDNVPFQKSFEADIEKYFTKDLYGNDRLTFYFGTVYWYLSKNGTDELGEIPVNERTIKYPIYKTPYVKGVIEGEDCKQTKNHNGEVFVKNMLVFGSGWSGEKQRVWKNAKIGDSLELKIDSEQEGAKDLIVKFTKGRNNAIIQLYFNNVKVGNEIDCYAPSIIPSVEIKVGKVKLKKGENILKILITGRNPKSGESNRVGLDYIKFE